MKTRLMKYFGILILLTTMVCLSSCEVEIDSWHDDDYVSDSYYNRTRDLCSRTWQESWEQDGNYYTQRLDFYDNRTGRDFLRVENRNGYVTEDTYLFDWKWDNNAQTRIRMIYGPGDVSYFEGIWIGGNALTGVLDDTEVHFTGIR